MSRCALAPVNILWIPYGILLPFGINAVNRMQRKFRSEESQSQLT